MKFNFRVWRGWPLGKRAAQGVTPEPGERDACWRIASDVSASLHEGGMVLFQESTGHIFTCNVIGAEIWEMLVSGRDAGQLESIAQRHGWPLEEFAQEAFRFIELLKEHGLIVPGGEQ